MPSVIHFEIGADDPERAVKFYTDVFGWKVERFEEAPYWLVEAPAEGAAEEGPGIGGAIMTREGGNTTVNTISVLSLDEYMAKVEAAGGKVISPRTTIPGIGYHAYCTDTEGNTFGILETDREAA